MRPKFQVGSGRDIAGGLDFSTFEEEGGWFWKKMMTSGEVDHAY